MFYFINYIIVLGNKCYYKRQSTSRYVTENILSPISHESTENYNLYNVPIPIILFSCLLFVYIYSILSRNIPTYYIAISNIL